MPQSNLTSFVCAVSQEKIILLKEYLDNRGWEIKTSDPNAFWNAAQDKLRITAYRSGKIMIQGKGVEDFIIFVLEPEILKELVYTKETAGEGTFSPHAGIDESGKGDFFGPLVVAAAFVDSHAVSQLEKAGVKDSKLIKSDRKIALIASEIHRIIPNQYVTVTIGPEAYNRFYDKIGNLNKLLAWGHARALENLLEKVPECKAAIADKFGNEHLITKALMEKGKNIELTQKTKAEQDIAVATASILARNGFVQRLAKMEIELGMRLPKGAGEPVDKAAIEIAKKFGMEKFKSIAKIHFKTFGRIAENCKTASKTDVQEDRPVMVQSEDLF